MRLNLTLAALLATVAMSGCAQIPGTAPVPGTGGTVVLPSPAAPAGSMSRDQLRAYVKEVQAQVVRACAFAPTFDTIAQVIGALGVPFIGGAGVIAEQVCQAVTTAPLADGPGDHRPRVAGVIIRGKHVRRR